MAGARYAACNEMRTRNGDRSAYRFGLCNVLTRLIEPGVYSMTSRSVY